MQEATSYDFFVHAWEKCSPLEKVLLQELAQGTETLFSKDARSNFSKKLGIAELTVLLIQKAIHALKRKGLIAPIPDHGVYYLDDFKLKNWVLEHIPVL